MRWISIKERLPAENTIVGVMAIDTFEEERRAAVVDPEYSAHVYEIPKFFIVFYCRDKNHSSPSKGEYMWESLGTVILGNIADKYEIKKWCSLPAINPIVREEIEKNSRWELLDL